MSLNEMQKTIDWGRRSEWVYDGEVDGEVDGARGASSASGASSVLKLLLVVV